MSCSTDGGTRSEIVEEESERGRGGGGEKEETGEKDEDSGRAESATRRQI